MGSYCGHTFAMSRLAKAWGVRDRRGWVTRASARQSCHLTSAPTTTLRRLCDSASPAMPKAAPRKVGSVSSAPANSTVHIKSVNQGRNKTGRAAASNVKTTVESLPPEPAPPPPLFVLPDPVDPESESEEEVLLTTPKGPSRAVSVSLHVSHNIESR